MHTDEAPVFPPPPAYYTLFARASKSSEASTDGGEVKFPLPPPAFPRSEESLRVFNDPIPYLPAEFFDPILTPEDRAYKGKEQELESGPVKATILDVEYRAELRRLLAVLGEKLIAATDALDDRPPDAKPRHELVKDVGLAVDNMFEMLSSYRQHEALLHMISRMRYQIQEKRGALDDLNRVIGAVKEQVAAANSQALLTLQGRGDGGAAEAGVKEEVEEEGTAMDVGSN